MQGTQTYYLVDERLSPDRALHVEALAAATSGEVILCGRKPVACAARSPWRAPRAVTLERALLVRHRTAAGRIVLHAWGPRAARFALDVRRRTTPAFADRVRVVIDCEVDLAYRRLFAAYPPDAFQPMDAVVARSEIARRALLRSGAPPESTHAIPPAVDFGLLSSICREDVRPGLGLEETHVCVLLLPPIEASGGTIRAAWGTLLAHIVRPELRILLPEQSRTAEQVARFVRASGRGALVRARDPVASPVLLRAADVALSLAAGPQAVSAIAWAQAAQTPLLLRATEATAEFVTHDVNGRFTTGSEPREIARRLLDTLEQPEKTRRLAETGRGHAFERFSRRAFLDAYAAIYAAGDAAAGRSLGVR